MPSRFRWRRAAERPAKWTKIDLELHEAISMREKLTNVANSKSRGRVGVMGWGRTNVALFLDWRNLFSSTHVQFVDGWSTCSITTIWEGNF